ncbi:MAG: lysophospholipid acyltransferase family protein [Alcanivorax sp.]
MRTAIAAFKFLLFTLLSLLVAPLQILTLMIHKGNGAYIIPWLWQKTVCKIFRIKVIVEGTPYTDSQTIYVSNHISYLDIPAVGRILRASFVAKKDVASWPVFGFLSKLQQTAFISRSREDAKKEKHALDNMLTDGKSLIIFPEGTSTDGREVLPFKSSLFSIAYREGLDDIMIQPFTISMSRVDNKDITTQEIRDIYSWHINMDTPLEKHLWRFAKSTGAEIKVTFHTEIRASDFSDRKTLAKTSHNAVSNGLNIKT